MEARKKKGRVLLLPLRRRDCTGRGVVAFLLPLLCLLLRISLAAAVVEKKKRKEAGVVSDGVYGLLVLDIRGLDKKEGWRKKTVPLVRGRVISGFTVGMYWRVGRRGSAGPLSSLGFFVGSNGIALSDFC